MRLLPLPRPCRIRRSAAILELVCPPTELISSQHYTLAPPSVPYTQCANSAGPAFRPAWSGYVRKTSTSASHFTKSVLNSLTSHPLRTSQSTAQILLVINVFSPGVGTMIASCTGNRCNRTTALVAVLQICTVPLLIGWIWAIVWSVALIRRNASLYPPSRVCSSNAIVSLPPSDAESVLYMSSPGLPDDVTKVRTLAAHPHSHCPSKGCFSNSFFILLTKDHCRDIAMCERLPPRIRHLALIGGRVGPQLHYVISWWIAALPHDTDVSQYIAAPASVVQLGLVDCMVRRSAKKGVASGTSSSTSRHRSPMADGHQDDMELF